MKEIISKQVIEMIEGTEKSNQSLLDKSIDSYNKYLDEFINSLSALKLDKDISVQRLKVLKGSLSILNSSVKRKHIEDLLDEVYAEYTYELEKMVRGE